MKKLLTTMGITSVLAITAVSCGNNRDQAAAEAELQFQRYKDSIRMAADTAGLAEYQQWKSQNELMYDSQQQDMQTPPVAGTSANRSAAKGYSSAPRRSSSSSRSSGSSGTSGSSSSTTASSKKGWSKAAKGAVIGGAGGAITGAVINKKNRAAGAVIGGVVGGAVGYGIGRHKDKKDGRY